jgi:Flp pilus assembly pilin Flp
MIRSLILYVRFILSELGITCEKGQTLAEYALIFLFIVIVVIVVLSPVGDQLIALYTRITNEFP